MCFAMFDANNSFESSNPSAAVVSAGRGGLSLHFQKRIIWDL